MIDSIEKRMSMLSFGRAGYTLPVAIGGFTQGERQHLLGLYSGILVGPPVPIVGAGIVDTICFLSGILDTVQFSSRILDTVRLP